MRWRGWLLGASAFSLVAALCAAPVFFSTPAGAASPASTTSTTTPVVPTFGPGFTVHHGANGELDVNACPTPAAGHASCLARIRIDQVSRSRKPLHQGQTAPSATIGNNGAYDPPYLQSAYQLPSSTNGTGETVAIVDAFDDPNAEADLGTYRSMWGLAACTTANGCFSKVNQTGSSSPATLPSPDGGWALEVSLDVDMVSAICPNCHILLVESNDNANANLAVAAQEAVTLGADAVSNSYGGGEGSGETTYDSAYDHPGIPVTVAAGDKGYGSEYPATSPGVVAVGGTTLTQLTNTGTRNATETAWTGTGSGCSSIETKQSWQHDPACTHRMETDVSAVADPNTPVWVYDTYPDNTNGNRVYDWVGVGGTSAATPIIAGVFALTGITPANGLQTSSFPYADPGALNDITSGSNGHCGTGSTQYYCRAGTGYDGPTGWGTPLGLGAFEPTPTVVTGVTPSSGSSGTSVTISGTGFNGATAVRFGATAATIYTVVSPTQITATAPTGSGTVDVTVTAPAGGTSATSSADQFTYGSSLPTVTTVSPAAGPLGGTSVTITGTGFTGATVVKFGSVAASTFTVNSATQITATAPAEAAGTVDVTVTAPGGTSGTSSADHFTYTAAPVVTGVSPAAGPLGGTSVTITGTGFTGATVVKFGSVAASTFTVNSATQITATAPAEAAGTVDVTVTAPGGTSGTSSADHFTYTAAPVVTGVSPAAGPLGGTSVTITGTGFTGATAVKFGSVAASTFTVSSATQITTTAPAGAAGTVHVTVTTPGGTSATSAADQFTYVAAPTVTGVSPVVGPLGGTAVTITGTNFSGATAVDFNATSVPFSVASATQITTTAPAGSPGTVNVTVTTPGGVSAISGADQFTYVAAPTVTGVSPASGPLGGTAVTITGTNLSGATAVAFGSTAASTYSVISGSQIDATAPAGSAGTVNVTVTTPGGVSGTSPVDQFTYVAGPIVTSVAPSAGPLGGIAVTITGTNLSGATAVNFGSSAATTYSVISGTQINATAPPESAGTVAVTVTTTGGTSASPPADDFSYLPVPTVTGVSPASGPTAGGTPVTITGSGFTGATSVDFGSTSIGFTVVSASQITATAPAQSVGTVDVTVTSPGGTSGAGAADQFTYLSTPTVTNVSPNQGPTAGGTSVTITGTGFIAPCTVEFGSTLATGVDVVSDTTIVVTFPAGSGTVDVTVTCADGTSATSGADHFTYVAAPTVTSVSPPAGPLGGTSVTITGTNFTQLAAVTCGSGPAVTITVVSATSIIATCPQGAAGTVDVTVTTVGGTSAHSNADHFTYVAAPTVTSVAPSSGAVTGATSVTITGTNLTGATAVAFGSVSAANFTVNSDSSITATSPAEAAGTVDVTVTTVGGTSTFSGADHFTFVVPPLTSVSPSNGSTSGGTSVTISGSDFKGATTAVAFGSVLATNFTVNSDSSISATSPAEAAGTVDVTVTTTYGTTPISSSDQFTFVAPPAVSSVTPNGGPTSGGSPVTIAGTGFSGATAVAFGFVAATSVTVVSATQITAVSPPDAAGVVNVSVTTPFGSSAVSSADQYTYVGPYVTAVSPRTVSVGGGGAITITGTGFTGSTAVTVGATAATSFTVASSTRITAVVPAEAAGAVDVTVTSPAGTSPVVTADRLTYEVPVLTRISPIGGPANRSTTVTLTGVLFTGASAVHFGSVPTVSFTVKTSTSIVAVAPPQPASTVAVTVTTTAGVTAATAADQFTYRLPTVTKVTPTSGTVAGSSAVLITGTLFSGATAVTFGGIPALGFTVKTASSITAVSPPHAAGIADIVVTASAGTSPVVTADHYTYVVPAVTKVSPASGPIAGGTTVTITGVMLRGASAVTFGTTPATSFTVVSATSITAVSPPGMAGGVHVEVTTSAGQTAATSSDLFTYLP